MRLTISIILMLAMAMSLLACNSPNHDQLSVSLDAMRCNQLAANQDTCDICITFTHARPGDAGASIPWIAVGFIVEAESLETLERICGLMGSLLLAYPDDFVSIHSDDSRFSPISNQERRVLHNAGRETWSFRPSEICEMGNGSIIGHCEVTLHVSEPMRRNMDMVIRVDSSLEDMIESYMLEAYGRIIMASVRSVEVTIIVE